MAFPNTGNAGQGRRPGVRNKVSKEAGQLILDVFHKIGGVEAMSRWAEANKDIFYVHILPKICRPVTLIVGGENTIGDTLQLNAVQVANPAEALTVLERLEDVRNAHSGGRRSSDEQEVERQLPAHEVALQAPDGGDVGVETAEGVSDASAPREDEAVRERLSVPLLVDVPAP